MQLKNQQWLISNQENIIGALAARVPTNPSAMVRIKEQESPRLHLQLTHRKTFFFANVNNRQTNHFVTGATQNYSLSKKNRKTILKGLMSNQVFGVTIY